MPSTDIAEALSITNSYLNSLVNNDEITVLNRLIEALKLAETLNMSIDFDF